VTGESEQMNYGVSPAFVVSTWGPRFSVANVCGALPIIRGLGFSGFQPEVYVAESLDEWYHGGAERIARAAADWDLRANVFVAHFLMERFASETALAADDDLDLLDRTIDVAGAFRDCHVLGVPLGPFRFQPDTRPSVAWHRDLQMRLAEKLHTYLSRATRAGFSLAVEILPSSVAGSFDGFLRLAESLGSPQLGVLLDTGHAWAMREAIEILPLKLAGRILGLHLKDNNGDVNQSLAPGLGTIPWTGFLRSLLAAGYRGSLDLEIRCPPDRVRAEYAGGLRFLKSLEIGGSRLSADTPGPAQITDVVPTRRGDLGLSDIPAPGNQGSTPLGIP
jgi:sugar phosphate isomerase/epimerase